MILGILFLLMGMVLIFVTIKGLSMNKKLTYALGGGFSTIGILIAIFDRIECTNGLLVCIGGSIGGLFLWAGLFSIMKKFECTTKIEAIYVGLAKYRSSKGGASYSPKFTYNFGGETYHASSGEVFSESYINKKYKEGYTYNIYINPKIPGEIITRKRLSLTEINLLVMGLLFIGVVISNFQF